MENRSKVKVRKWIDTPDTKRYERYISDWHYFLKRAEKKIEENAAPAFKKNTSLYILKKFYLTPYEPETDFYDQFGKRLEAASFL